MRSGVRYDFDVKHHKKPSARRLTIDQSTKDFHCKALYYAPLSPDFRALGTTVARSMNQTNTKLGAINGCKAPRPDRRRVLDRAQHAPEGFRLLYHGRVCRRHPLAA